LPLICFDDGDQAEDSTEFDILAWQFIGTRGEAELSRGQAHFEHNQKFT